MKKFLLSIIMIMALMPLTVKADEIIVGEGTDAKNLAPFVNSYPNSWCEVVYEASEIGKACTIGSVAFNYVAGTQLTANDIRIYLAETTKTEFADKSSWTAEEDLTLVYSGTDVVLGDEAWETFEFEIPFNYSGENNLVIVVAKSAPKMELTLTWSCYDDPNSVMFTASDTDASFAQYPVGEGLAIYGKKPVMKLIEAEETVTSTELLPPTNLRATVEQDVAGYNYKYRVTMMWDAVEGADAYDVFVNTATATDYYLGFSSGTTYIVGSNNAGTLEFYVVAFNDETESEASEKCTVIIGDVAVEEITPSFNVYPNPVENNLYIETELNVKEIAIYDIYGKETKVYSLQTTDFVNTVDVTELKDGVYFVKIMTDNGEVVKRFIKK